MTAPVLKLTSVKKSFGAVRALKGVSLDLHAGEVHALLGENGAGKSTLIKVITGAHQPEGGSIQVNGKTVENLSPSISHKLGIACIYQQPALFPDMSVGENIGLRLEAIGIFKKVDWAHRRQRATELLNRIGANIDSDAEVRQLSMPEQQLVEIACALGTGAGIIIMDEPTASLTQKEQHLLFKIVHDLRDSGVGVIYISHRLEEIFTLADRVTVLRDGESVDTRIVPTSKRDGSSSIDYGSEIEPVHSEAELIRLMVGREVDAIFPPADGEPGEPVLTLDKICCSASGIEEVSLNVSAGEVVGLAGLVGAGRTELARVLFGITPSDGGRISLNGQTVEIDSPQTAIRHGIGYVPEDRRRHGVILEMPIAENMTMAIHPRLFPGGILRQGPEQEIAQQFILDLSIKTDGPNAPGGSLSGGNQQKVSLARWLATKPKLLILDEPTQGVDVGAKSEIHRIIRDLAKKGLAVLMISSDLPEILGMSDRIYVMGGGRITAELPGSADAHTVMTAALGQPEEGGVACS